MTDSPSKRLGLLTIRRFIVVPSVLDETIGFLREAGADGCEGFVLWGGTSVSSEAFRFTSALVPHQHAIKSEKGLLVYVDGEALFTINKTLHERQEILGGQVHTHPSSAYHSSTDDHFPMVTVLGALSIVVPDFAKNAPNDIGSWAWYRLQDYGNWVPAGEDTEIEFE